MGLTHSDDNGRSWAPTREITAQIKPGFPHHPQWGWYATTFSGIQLRHQPHGSTSPNGRLMICADHVEHQWTAYPIKNGHSHVIFSDDGGDNWQVGGIVPTNYTNECSLAELSNGTVVMNVRNYIGQSNNTVHRGISWSHDGGLSFRKSTLLQIF